MYDDLKIIICIATTASVRLRTLSFRLIVLFKYVYLCIHAANQPNNIHQTPNTILLFPMYSLNLEYSSSPFYSDPNAIPSPLPTPMLTYKLTVTVILLL